MTQPVILINCDTFAVPLGHVTGVRQTYWEAVERAGGIPLLLPHLERPAALRQVLDLADGVLLVGGDDISFEKLRQAAGDHADVYAGGPTGPEELTPPHDRIMPPRREATDFNLIELLVERNKPTLGICLAHQEVAVAHGGTLLTHLPRQLPAIQHVYDAQRDCTSSHGLRVAPASLLARIWDGLTSAEINSAHHQGVRDAGRGPVPVAWAPDDLIEALEIPGHPFFLTVQWHPERMAGDALQEKLFTALVEAARTR